jgi:AraC-like DNA-binding protein/quercetin dioxygenase-like cupin family protein
MKVEFEIIHPDEGSSFRLLHEKVIAEKYGWQYHFHPEYEIVCVLSGRGTRHVGNNISHYENGDLVFMGPNLPHAGFGLNAHGLHEEIVIQIKEEVFNQSILTRPEMISIGLLLEKVKYGIYFTGQTKEKITKRLIKLLKLPAFDKYIELISILQTMAVSPDYYLLNPDTTISSAITKNNIRLQNIFNYVEQHFQEEINIRKAASVANLSVPSFCNYFRKIMNSTFTDFVNQYRIQMACNLLQKDKTIYETCFECGFNNITYFNKVFKTITQKTPSAFKKEKLQSNSKNKERA